MLGHHQSSRFHQRVETWRWIKFYLKFWMTCCPYNNAHSWPDNTSPAQACLHPAFNSRPIIMRRYRSIVNVVVGKTPRGLKPSLQDTWPCARITLMKAAQCRIVQHSANAQVAWFLLRRSAARRGVMIRSNQCLQLPSPLKKPFISEVSGKQNTALGPL